MALRIAAQNKVLSAFKVRTRNLAALALLSIPITFIALYFGEGAFKLPIILLLVIFWPSMLVAEVFAFNSATLGSNLVQALFYLTQYLYFFSVIVAVNKLIVYLRRN